MKMEENLAKLRAERFRAYHDFNVLHKRVETLLTVERKIIDFGINDINFDDISNICDIFILQQQKLAQEYLIADLRIRVAEEKLSKTKNQQPFQTV